MQRVVCIRRFTTLPRCLSSQPNYRAFEPAEPSQHFDKTIRPTFRSYRTDNSNHRNNNSSSSSTKMGDTAVESTASSFLSFLFNMLTKIGYTGAGLAVMVATLLYVKQDSLLYYPEIGGLAKKPDGNPRGYRSPRERQIPFESHMITCADGVRIHAWLLQWQQQPQQPDEKNVPTLVFFHGNAGNIGLRLPNAIQMRQQLHVNILMVEYRGYGESESTPSEAGIRLDAQAALHFCQSHASIQQVFVFGRSLGGAVAFHLAAYAQQEQIPLAGVIVENTFTSIADMVDQLLPMLAPFKALVLRIGWRSKDIVPNLTTTPTLYLAGDRDEIVPHSHMLELYQAQKQNSAASSLVQMHIIPGGTHNESWLQGGPAYWDSIRNFMRQALSLQSSGRQDLNPSTDGLVQDWNQAACDASTDPAGAAAGIPSMSTNLMGMARNSMSGAPEKDKKKN